MGLFDFLKKSGSTQDKSSRNTTSGTIKKGHVEGIIPDGIYYQEDIGIRPRFTGQKFYQITNGQMSYFSGVGSLSNLERCEYCIVGNQIKISFPDLAKKAAALGLGSESDENVSTYLFRWIDENSKAKGFCFGNLKFIAK